MTDPPNRELLKLAAWPIFFLFLGLAVYWLLLPGRGYRELHASQEALRTAKSWRSLGRVRLEDGTWQTNYIRNIACPTEFDQSYRDAFRPDVMHRHVLVGGVYYDRQDDGSWHHSPNPYFPVLDCGRGPLVEGFGFLYPSIEEIARNGEVQAGGRDTTEHGECRWWRVVLQRGSPPSYSVCLDESSHLPLELDSQRFGYNYLFWDWNAMTIEAPVDTE